MKKILGLAIAAVLIMATVGFGTWSYFSDQESSNDNQITAGTLDMKINNADADYTILTGLTNKGPGDTGSNFAPLKNAGSLPGKFSLATGAVTNTGATIGTGEFADGVGNLGANSLIAPWVDVNANSIFDSGDLPLKSDQTVKTYADGKQWDTWDNFASKTWDPVIASLAPHPGPNNIINFYIDWSIDGSKGNNIQGDSVKLSFTFYLDQIH